MHNLNIGKKESIFSCILTRKTEYVRQSLIIQNYCRKPGSLVFNNINNNNNIKNNTRWKDLEKIKKFFYICHYGAEYNYKAFTCRLSTEFNSKLKNTKGIEDAIRRKLNANFRYNLGYIPEYAFVLEDKTDENKMHMHGIIDVKENQAKIKEIFKRTFFGKNHRLNTMKNFICHIEPLYDATKWSCYLFKRYYTNKNAFKFYCTRALSSFVREKHLKIVRK